MLTGYMKGGFRFEQMSIAGSIGIVNKVAFRWNVTDAKDITLESLSFFLMLHPKIDLIVIGTGEKLVRIPREVTMALRNVGVGVEIQSTKHACGTFNLLREHRPAGIAAALIPTSHSDDESFKRAPKNVQKNLSTSGQMKFI